MDERKSAEARLRALGIELPAASAPKANYCNCVRTGNLLYVAGKGPAIGGSSGLTVNPRGKLGREYSTEQGYDFARAAGLDVLAALRLELGTLDRIERVVKLQGFVNATEDFEQHPKVLDGASDLMTEVFGDRGVHARSVFGAVSLRGGLPVIVDSVFEVVETLDRRTAKKWKVAEIQLVQAAGFLHDPSLFALDQWPLDRYTDEPRELALIDSMEELALLAAERGAKPAIWRRLKKAAL